MAVNLSSGAIARMQSGNKEAMEINPIVQVTELRVINSTHQQFASGNAQERYRLVLSDGDLQQQGMLATQKNELVKSGRLQKGSIVQLVQFICNRVQNRWIVVIIDLDVILEKSELIGNPASPAVRPSASGQPPIVRAGAVGNAQTFGTSCSNSSVSNAGASRQYPGMQQSSNSARSGHNMSPTRNGISNTPSMYSRAESEYGNHSTGIRNYKAESSPLSSNVHVRPPQLAVYRQPPAIYSNRGPVNQTEAPPRIVPIAALNPYQGKWTIKARVTAKAEMRHYHNARGDGKVFSFDLLDSEGGEIRVTCFNSVADQFYIQIEAGRVYLISKGSLKPSQKTFNNQSNDHEIFLDSTSIIQPCFEDDKSIPQQQFHFRTIRDIEKMENRSVVDILGVVSSINPISSIARKNGTETQKKSLQLRDMSGCSVEVTLWGNFCNAEGQDLQRLCDREVCPILAVKSGIVNDYSGKAVGTISTSQLFIEPDIPEARKMRDWFANEGRNTPSISISRDLSSVGRTEIRKTISQIKSEKLGTSHKPDWITVDATITYMKLDNFCYTSCPIMVGDRQCNRKVTRSEDGKWHCEKCDQCVSECNYRYILQFQIQDHTGLAWVTVFQEVGQEVMGMPAKDLYYLKYESQDDEQFIEITRRVCFNKYIMKLKVKEEMFNDEARIKSTVVKVEKVKFSSESRVLLDQLYKLKAQDPICGTQNISQAGLSNIENIPSRQYASPSSFGCFKSNASREYGPVHGTQFGNTYNLPRPLALHCDSCGVVGHTSINCPSLNVPRQLVGLSYPNSSSYGIGSGDSSGNCYKCHQSGHWSRDCPGLSTVPPAYGNNAYDHGRYRFAAQQQFSGC